ncbi:uncharacterized protein LOC108963368 [Serinus canaria]|uniref:uncharacterized protein LOC108963368 n=1 Tax=Serinus canaria TaxID=9135 RepID=UPI0008DB4D8E|nr:uncharacterized protein LOC108963368 [Serinus canaria]XP_030095470.1 uncharacterized protein LOC108963368 [Serinus canaria]
MEMIKDAKAWKLPPALDKYKSIYRKDFCWHDDYHSPIQAHVPAPSYPPLGDLPKCYLPECQPSDLCPRWAGKLEILHEPVHDLSCLSPLPPQAEETEGESGQAAQSDVSPYGLHLPPRAAEISLPSPSEGVLEPREPPPSNTITYQQFAQDLYKEVLSNADKYKTKNRSSCILLQDCSDLDWKSIYKQDFEPRRGIHAGLYTEEIRPSPIFPEDFRFNESRWVTEYGDSYSIFLKRLDWSSPISGQWLPFGKDARWTPRWKLAGN